MLNEIDLSRVDLNLLVLYEAVLRERNVGRAAARLNLTPSAVSHGLGRLRRLLNDPLFLRTPKGVVPTERAEELAGPVGEILARVRGVIATADGFDPATSTRRFLIGAPDAVLAVVSRALLDDVRRKAPDVDIGLRHLLAGRGRLSERAWEGILPILEAREIDLAILPIDGVPARFEARVLYREDFVAVFRKGHAFATDPSLDHYCALRHLLVSQPGHAFGFVDEALEKHGRTRRVAVTAPNFMIGLALLAESDLVAAMPRRLAVTFATRFGLDTAALPLSVAVGDMRVVVPRSAMADAGIAWLYDTVLDCAGPASSPRADRKPAS
ncbi:MAG: LysR family transcriptional regulator [Alphaproteobacteria bacterium]